MNLCSSLPVLHLHQPHYQHICPECREGRAGIELDVGGEDGDWRESSNNGIQGHHEKGYSSSETSRVAIREWNRFGVVGWWVKVRRA